MHYKSFISPIDLNQLYQFVVEPFDWLRLGQLRIKGIINCHSPIMIKHRVSGIETIFYSRWHCILYSNPDALYI